MQENHENENAEFVDNTSSENPVSKKLYQRPKFLIGVAITIVIDLVAIITQNEFALWSIFILPFITGIALMLSKNTKDIGMGVFSAIIFPLLLFLLLFGACLIGIEGFTLFQ
jgi:hypothetical protein